MFYSSMDFQYVVEKQKKSKICFGSGLEREFLDFDTKGMVSKHATSNLKKIYKNAPELGPGAYYVIQKSQEFTKPTSLLGTVIGGRTAPRGEPMRSFSDTPGPIYNISGSIPTEFRQNSAPFNSRAKRHAKIGRKSNVPGVGVYKVAPYKRKRVVFSYSFGGKKCLLPVVKMKCGPYNFDKCERCDKHPEGDYWYLDLKAITGNKPELKKTKKEISLGVFLCRRCYDLENSDHKLFNKIHLRHFKKIRDCSKIHFHDGCQAKLFLVSPQEIEKVKERESYMSLYYK